MIRSWIRSGAAGILHQSGADKLFASWSGSRKLPVVIGYHRVVEDYPSSASTSIPSMLVSRRMLEQHLDWIGRRFRFASLDDVGRRLQGGDSSNDPIAAITFDDGYRDFYEQAFPLLMKKGVPAAVFAVTDLVSTPTVHVHDKLYLLLLRRCRRQRIKCWDGIALPNIDEMTPYQATRTLLEALPYSAIQEVIRALEADVAISKEAYQPFQSMTWDMLAEVHSAGLTVGSHTRSHVLMPNEAEPCVMEEAAGSRKALEKHLGAEIKHFAYPGGLYNTTSVHAVAAAGYRFAYTTCTHRDSNAPLLTVPRSVLWENSCLDARRFFSGSILSCQIHHAFDWVNGCKQAHSASDGSRYGGN